MEKNSNLTDKKDINLSVKPSHEAVFMNMSKKTEKISTALYMVTDLIDSSDPIKQRIRQCSIDLISETRAMSHAFSGDVYFMIARSISKSWEIVSLLEVSSSVGFISDMNARILKSVLIELISSLRDKQKRESFSKIEDLKIGESFADQISLSKSLFDVKKEDLFEDKILEPRKINIKDTEMSLKNSRSTERAKTDNLEEKKEAPKKISSEKPESTNKPKPSERRSKILDIVKEKGEVVVGDILSSFPGISSKTIQRELTSLVEEDVLKRMGEKRWSKYSLN
ncbi:MAG: hypothetical protein R3B55_00010 [Candidatus Paceibacterota bacterium]